MTPRAVPSEFPKMNILLGMTAEAIHRKTCIIDIFLRMAIIASGLRMLAGQREFCLPTMVERDAPPAIGRMTGFTARGEAAGVHVIARMTVRASDAGVLESRRFMARFTGNRHMQPGEWKIRDAMVKYHILPP